jgi:hypothetical protein
MALNEWVGRYFLHQPQTPTPALPRSTRGGGKEGRPQKSMAAPVLKQSLAFQWFSIRYSNMFRGLFMVEAIQAKCRTISND